MGLRLVAKRRPRISAARVRRVLRRQRSRACADRTVTAGRQSETARYFAICLGACFSGALLAACGANRGFSPPTSVAPVSALPQELHRSTPSGGASIRVLYDFSGGTDGGGPAGGLIADGNGNYYGTTNIGGAFNSFCNAYDGCGTVYELARLGKHYAEKALYAFQGPPDGVGPYSENLISDETGALYGTTYGGGDTACGSGYGCGTVFKLTHAGTAYTESILYSFAGSDGGGGPLFGLISDARGNLYGTTSGGTNYADGAVYELKRAGSSYSEHVLHVFQNDGSDGIQPSCALILDARGALYGTTTAGGAYSFGTVFKLTPSHGTYLESVLYSFGSRANDGESPWAGLLAGANGVLYGTTGQGGTTGNGTVFRLTGSRRSYTESALYSFHGSDGSFPQSPLILRHGAIYGTTFFGGAAGIGVVFKVSLTGSEKVLHSFGCGSDNGYPYAGLLPDARGNLLGTSSGGCSSSGAHGAVFELR